MTFTNKLLNSSQVFQHKKGHFNCGFRQRWDQWWLSQIQHDLGGRGGSSLSHDIAQSQDLNSVRLKLRDRDTCFQNTCLFNLQTNVDVFLCRDVSFIISLCLLGTLYLSDFGLLFVIFIFLYESTVWSNIFSLEERCWMSRYCILTIAIAILKCEFGSNYYSFWEPSSLWLVLFHLWLLGHFGGQ